MGDLKDILLLMDSYFIYPRITFKQKEKFNTFIGLIFTLISICLFIILISINIKKVFSRTHFNLISSLIESNDILELQNIQLTFGILKDYENFFPCEKNFINFQLIQFFYNHDGSYVPLPINLYHCDEVSNSDYLSQSFNISKNILHNVLCTDPNEKLYILPKAGTRSSVFSMLYLYIRKCNNELDNIECMPEALIDQMASSFYLLLAYMTNNVDHDNFTNPVFQIPRYDAFFFSKDIEKEVNYYFQKNVYETDDGLLFSNKKNESFISFDRFFSEYNIKNENNSINYGSIQFFGNNYINKYKRTYIRIFDIIADVKSYVDIVYSFINIFLFFIVRKMFYVDMIQSIYFNYDDLTYKNTIKIFKDKKKENTILNLRENLDDRKKKTSKPQTLKMNSKYKKNQNYFNEKDEQSSKRKIKIKSKPVKVKTNKQKFEYNYYYYILPLICFKTNKNIKLYNKLYDEIIKNIGLENIYKNLYIGKEIIYKNFMNSKDKIQNIEENIEKNIDIS